MLLNLLGRVGQATGKSGLARALLEVVGASNASSVALDDLDDWISHGNPKSGGLVAGIDRA